MSKISCALWENNTLHTLIISGGTIDTDFALDLLKKEKYDHIIGVDGALKFCKEQNIVPTRIVGDFDTLDPEILTWYQTNTQIEIRQFNPVKDATDTQIAIELAMELGSRKITLIGGTGTRLDHVLGNIQTLYLPFAKGIAAGYVLFCVPKENQKSTSDFDALDPRERGCSPLSDPEGVVEAQKC